MPNSMSSRPLSVTLIGGLFIVAGVLQLGFFFYQLNFHRPLHYDDALVGLVRLLAVVCGVFLLRGNNWARWLAIAWLVFHVGVSAFGSARDVVVHGLLFGVIAYFLLRSEANQFFRSLPKPGTEIHP
jgi:hypothetical protein